MPRKTRAQDLIRRYMSPVAWVLALRRARQHVCCGREQQGCAVQAVWGVEGAGAHSCAAPAGAGLGLTSAAQTGGMRLGRTSPNAAKSAWRIRKSRP
jgi:hypothetical protein